MCRIVRGDTTNINLNALIIATDGIHFLKFRGKFISHNDQDKIVQFVLNDLDVPKVLNFLKEVKPLSESENNVSIDLLLEALLGLKLEEVA